MRRILYTEESAKNKFEFGTFRLAVAQLRLTAAALTVQGLE
jgi:hypothetical protein